MLLSMFPTTWPGPVAAKRRSNSPTLSIFSTRGKKIVIMAGRGAIGAGEELAAVAERLNAPIVKPLLGKAAIADDHPNSLGGTGLLGTLPAQEVLEDCDTLLIVGSSFPYIEFYPKPGQAKTVQIEIDPMRIGLRYPVDAALIGDVGRVLEVMLPKLSRHEERGFPGTRRKAP